MSHTSLRNLARIAALLYTSSSPLTALASHHQAPEPVKEPKLDVAETTTVYLATAAAAIPTAPQTTVAPLFAPARLQIPTTIAPLVGGGGHAAAAPGSGIGAQVAGENLLFPAQLSQHPDSGALNIKVKSDEGGVPPIMNVGGAGFSTPPNYLTIRIVNRHSRALSKTHARNWDSPTAVMGSVNPGVIPTGATTAFAVPTNWAGMVALGEARFGTPQDSSLIEASFVEWKDFGVAVAAVDISYVDAFTVPIVCSCSGVVVTGCNKGLWGISKCPAKDKVTRRQCTNPTRPYPDLTTPAAFFSPCRGAAYTYAKDDLATSYGQCQSGVITCCVGRRCAPNPNQPKGRKMMMVRSGAPEEEEGKHYDVDDVEGAVDEDGGVVVNEAEFRGFDDDEGVVDEEDLDYDGVDGGDEEDDGEDDEDYEDDVPVSMQRTGSNDDDDDDDDEELDDHEVEKHVPEVIEEVGAPEVLRLPELEDEDEDEDEDLEKHVPDLVEELGDPEFVQVPQDEDEDGDEDDDEEEEDYDN